MKKGFLAILTALAVFALVMTGCDTGGDPAPETWTVSFNTNGGTPSTIADIKVEKGKAIGSLLPAAPQRASYSFGGWFLDTDTTFSGTQYTASAPDISADTSLKAKWVPLQEGIVEDITIANAWFPIFQFTLPNGKTWADYSKLTADYKVADAAAQVRARILGNYPQEEITTARLGEFTPTGGTAQKVAVVASWPGGTSNRWIMNNFKGNPVAASSLGLSDNEWGTVEYTDLKTSFFADWNGGVYTGGNNANPSQALEGRVPAATATGPFYFALGFILGGGNTDAFTYGIMNVKLVAADGSEVKAMPLYYSKGSDKYRAYAGQLDGNKDATTGLFPNFNNGKPGWTVLQGDADIVPVAYTDPANVSISFNTNFTTVSTDDTAPAAPATVTQIPGNRITPPALGPFVDKTTPGNVWILDGWYTAATGGVIKDANAIFNTDATLYAQYKSVIAVNISFNLSGATGTTMPNAAIQKGTSLKAAQFALPSSGITPPSSKVFGGWYSVATTSWSAADYTKLIKTTTTFDADTTIYAYWYTPGSTDVTATGDFTNVITVEALGGGRIDEDGYIIFASGADNATINGNANDTLLSFKFPSGVDHTATSTGNIKITYTFKEILAPTITAAQESEGWVKDAGYAWKNGYNSWTGSGTAGNPGSYASFKAAGDTLTRGLKFFEGANPNEGVSIQINGGDDANNKQKRAGYVYGIKITAIEFTSP